MRLIRQEILIMSFGGFLMRWVGHEGWDRLVAGLLEILERTSKGFDQGRSEGIGVVGNRR